MFLETDSVYKNLFLKSRFLLYIPVFTKSQTGVYNGGFSISELLLLVRNSIYMAKILCGLSYKV